MTRLLTVLLALALVAIAQPSLVEANRGARAKTAKTATTKQARVNSARPSRVKALGKKTAAQFKMRAAVRAQTSTAKTARKQGQLELAAKEISRSPLRNAKGQYVKGAKTLSFRERFAVWRTTRAVKNSALKQAKDRSSKGDLNGTADALNALSQLEGKGKLGVYARWQKARATKKAFRNIEKSAKRSLQSGDTEAAGQSFMFATELRPGSRAAKSMAKNLVKESFTLAKTYAKTGQPQLTWSVLEMGAAIAHEGGAKFSEKQAQKLVDSSFKRALPVLTAGARQAYKSGDLNQATALLAEARAIQRNGNAKASGKIHRQQVKLAAKLGPTLVQFEAAQAQAQAQAVE